MVDFESFHVTIQKSIAHNHRSAFMDKFLTKDQNANFQKH